MYVGRQARTATRSCPYPAMECWEFLTDAWLSSLVGQQLNIEHFDVLEAEGNSSSTLVKVQCKTDTLMLKVTRQVAADALAALVDRAA